jgi:5-methylcytosine-specific restriction endonuclease McrA
MGEEKERAEKQEESEKGKMKRKPLISLTTAIEKYGYKPVARPQLVADGICQWCGKNIKGNRRKSFCSKECSDDFHRLVTWGRTRNAYSNQIVWRDNLACQDCGQFLAFENNFGIPIPLEVGAEVHHINPVECGGEDNPKNLITLCRECHKNRHKALKERSEGE